MPDVSAAVIDAVRDVIRRQGVDALVVDDLTEADLSWLGWSGNELHIKSVSDALSRVPSGDVEYLVVRAPSGEPIAKGAVYNADPLGPGALWQLATHGDLQGLGIGTRLIRALEERARSRGLTSCWLGVELDNPRARTLYERLGYVAFGERDDGWDAQDSDGRTYWYATRVTLMRRSL